MNFITDPSDTTTALELSWLMQLTLAVNGRLQSPYYAYLYKTYKPLLGVNEVIIKCTLLWTNTGCFPRFDGDNLRAQHSEMTVFPKVRVPKPRHHSISTVAVGWSAHVL